MKEIAGRERGPPGGGEGVGSGVGPAVARTTLYSCLVTRHTGRAVRRGILDRLGAHERGVLVVLDFRNVQLIDFSCADEVVAKLLVEPPGTSGTAGIPGRFFLVCGVAEHHLDPIESALRRQELAVAAEDATGAPLLLGSAEPSAVRAWREVWRLGRSSPARVAAVLEEGEATVVELLERLHERRLLYREGAEFVSFRRLLSEAGRGGRDP